MNNIASLKFFTGEMLLLTGAFIVLFRGPATARPGTAKYTAAAFALLAALAFRHPARSLDLFYGAFILEPVTERLRRAAAFVIGAAMLFSFRRTPRQQEAPAEYWSLLLFLEFGLILLAGARNLLMAFLSFEFVCLDVHLIALCAADEKGWKSGLEGLLRGGAGSAIMLYGMSFLYGLSGSLDFSSMAGRAGTGKELLLYGIALFLVFAGAFFRIGAALSPAAFSLWRRAEKGRHGN